MTFSPVEPVRSKMAISSVLLRCFEPYSTNRSLGLSWVGISRIVGWCGP
jgi:hypothetical protein